ncbi:VOC family protein [Arthrobacter sp. YAF17]|uniref:VOC family protein n=1 Tax=Arthrobacter sp. YAF17 TaxID=3233077 RepID=UPI003F8D92BD
MSHVKKWPFRDDSVCARAPGELKAKGAEFFAEADEETAGPASFIVLDPDGNPVLVDQHV